MNPIDPITLEIMRNRWRGIADEGCAAMIRTSYSPNIKDRYDCSTALALADGQVLAQAEIGTPLHLGVMPSVLSSILRKFPARTIRPGDAIITNLPYPEGPGHLPDLSMVSPVYHGADPDWPVEERKSSGNIEDTEHTLEFVRRVLEAESLVASLCGHVHLSHADALNTRAIQYAGAPTFEGYSRIFEFQPL